MIRASGRIYDAYGSRPLFVIAAVAELAPMAVLLAFRRKRFGGDGIG